MSFYSITRGYKPSDEGYAQAISYRRKHSSDARRAALEAAQRIEIAKRRAAKKRAKAAKKRNRR